MKGHLIPLVGFICSLCILPVFAQEEITVTSPNYPDRTPNDQDHVEYLSVEPSQHVVIHIDEFDLEGSDSSTNTHTFTEGSHDITVSTNCWDWLHLSEMCSGSVVELFLGCGSQTFTDPIEAECSEVRLHFHSDEDFGGQGYVLRYEGSPALDDVFLPEDTDDNTLRRSAKFILDQSQTPNSIPRISIENGAIMCALKCMREGMSSFTYNALTNECQIFESDGGEYDLEP